MHKSDIHVSVIVPVKNEAHNIKGCIESLSRFDDIHVVDSNSTDGTTEIAAQMGVQVTQFFYHGGWPKKKNWAFNNLNLKHNWVLVIDADERITEQLADEIATAVQDDRFAGYYVRWQFFFLGRWMKHCWSHGWMLRLFRKGHGEYEDLGMRDQGGWDNEVHENILVRGASGKLQSFLVHETNVSISQWLTKQNQFSDWNASRRLKQLQEPIPSLAQLWSSDPLKRRRFLKAIYIRLPFQPLIQFCYFYIVRLGFLDGVEGYYFCALRGAHELNTRVKMYEARRAMASQSG